MSVGKLKISVAFFRNEEIRVGILRHGIDQFGQFAFVSHRYMDLIIVVKNDGFFFVNRLDV